MTSPKKAVFVLVPGSFTPVTFFDKLILCLTADGYAAHPVPLPSVNADGKRKEDPATMQDDAAAISDVISQLVNEDYDVVVVMLSYGGYPGTEACRGLSKAERQEKGKSGGILGLVYMASFIPAVGTSVYTTQGEPELIKNAVSRVLHPPCRAAAGDGPYKGDYCYLDDEEMYKYIFPDLPEAEAREYTAQLENHSTVSFHGVVG
jgi:pimeloyl-ACP methyl ester carboxylesterase